MIEEIWALIINWCLKSKKWKCKQQKKRQRKKQEKTKDKYKNWEKNQTPQTTKLGHRGEPRTGEQAQERRRYRVTVAAFTRSLYGSLFRLNVFMCIKSECVSHMDAEKRSLYVDSNLKNYKLHASQDFVCSTRLIRGSYHQANVYFITNSATHLPTFSLTIWAIGPTWGKPFPPR